MSIDGAHYTRAELGHVGPILARTAHTDPGIDEMMRFERRELPSLRDHGGTIVLATGIKAK